MSKICLFFKDSLHHLLMSKICVLLRLFALSLRGCTYITSSAKGGSFRQNMTIDDIYFGGSSNKKYDNMTVRGRGEFPPNLYIL